MRNNNYTYRHKKSSSSLSNPSYNSQLLENIMNDS